MVDLLRIKLYILHLSFCLHFSVICFLKWLESMLLLTFFFASSELLDGHLLMITVRCCARRFWYIASCVWHNKIPLTNVLQLFKTKISILLCMFWKDIIVMWMNCACCLLLLIIFADAHLSFLRKLANALLFRFSLHSSLFRSLNFDWFAARFLWL